MRRFGIGLLLFALGISPALHKIHADTSISTPTSIVDEQEEALTFIPKKEMGATGASGATGNDMDLQSVRKKVLRSTGGLESISSLNLHNSISSDMVSISFESKILQTMKVEIFDYSGKKILSWDESLSDGPNKIIFNKKYIASGIYFIQASTEEGNLVRKFLN